MPLQNRTTASTDRCSLRHMWFRSGTNLCQSCALAAEVEAELNKYKEETAEITALSEAIGMNPNEINMYAVDVL